MGGQRRLVLAGVVSAALVASGSVYAVAHPGSTPSLVRHESSGSAVEALRGRWVAVSLDGQDVSGWRDISGLPASLIIGADRKPNGWQVNSACGPPISGRFTLWADGSFTPTVPLPSRQHCPAFHVTRRPPDLRGALGRTAFVTVDGVSPRTLYFFGDHKQLIMSWREDAALGNLARLCRKVLDERATYGGSFTTIEQIRRQYRRDNSYPHGRISMGVPPDTVAVYCHATAAHRSRRFAITATGRIFPIK